jgi:hypothetical protein
VAAMSEGDLFVNYEPPAKRKEHEDGTKKEQTPSEDRLAEYRAWHKTLGPRYYSNDIDSIEWRGGEPVAILELTRIDYETREMKVLDSIWYRITKRDQQSKMLDKIAHALGIFVFIVAFMPSRDARAGLKAFWIRRIGEDTEWKRYTLDEYEEWIKNL